MGLHLNSLGGYTSPQKLNILLHGPASEQHVLFVHLQVQQRCQASAAGCIRLKYLRWWRVYFFPLCPQIVFLDPEVANTVVSAVKITDSGPENLSAPVPCTVALMYLQR